MDWKRLKEQNSIGRTGNVAHGNPNDFVILGLDDDYSFDEVAVRLEDERDRAILRYACKDTERLKDELPDEFIAGFGLTGGNVDPIHFWQVITKDGESIPLVTDGRCRCMALRKENEKREEEGKAPLIIDAIPDTFLSKNPSLQALRMKRLRNRHVAETLAVHAEAAGDFSSQGETPEGIAREMCVTVERAKELLAWAPLFPRFCDEARRRANDGRLRLRGAKELVAKFPNKAEQEAYFAGKVALRGSGGGGAPAARPLSPRVVRIFTGHIGGSSATKTSREFLLGLRLAMGDKAAADELTGDLRAAWLKTQEEAAKKPRRVGGPKVGPVGAR